jgi:hypothetical protein
MSIQRNVEAGDMYTIPETKSQKVARLAQILDRGVINQRLNPKGLPDDLVGQWMPDDPNENTRMELLGFVDGSKYVSENATSKSGTGVARVGDVRYWVIPKEEHELIEAAQEQLKARKHGDRYNQIEEKTLLNENAGPDIKQLAESKIEEVDANHIKAATSSSMA